MVRRITFKIWGGGRSPPPPPPPPSPPPPPPTPPPPPPGTCLGLDTPVLLKDLTWMPIRDVRVGDEVVTLTGRGGKVTAIHRPLLTSFRRMAVLRWGGLELRFSDDHDLWVMDGDGSAGWGTFNYNWWMHDARYEGTLDVPARPLCPIDRHTVATADGWLGTRIEYELEQDPEEELCGLTLDEGAGFVAGGFVVIADGCTVQDLAYVNWCPPF